jgi:predicted RNA-binding Zn-ribbon protein involved in translation (DUF1610 family)
MQQFRCPTCGRELATQDELENHQRREHQSAGLECPECGATFVTRTQLSEHEQLEHQPG